MTSNIPAVLSSEGVLDYFSNAPTGEIEHASPGGKGHALGAALNAAASIVSSIGGEQFGQLLEMYFLGEARTAVGFHLIVDAATGEERVVGIMTAREVDSEAVVAAIQEAALA